MTPARANIALWPILTVVFLLAPLTAGRSDAQEDSPEDGPVSGKVVDRRGQPIPSCKVVLWRLWKNKVPHQRGYVLTNSDGRFEFAEIPPGRWFAFFGNRRSPDWSSHAPDWEPVHVKPGGASEIVLGDERQGVRVNGTVMCDGAPAPRAFVRFVPLSEPARRGPVGARASFRWTFADGNGDYTLSGLAPGDYCAYFVVPTRQADPGEEMPRSAYQRSEIKFHSRVSIPESSPASALDIHAGNRELAGIVKGPDGLPLDAARVALLPSELDHPSGFRSMGITAETEANGEFKFERLQRGRYDLLVLRGEDPATYVRRGVMVEPWMAQIEIQMKQIGQFSARVAPSPGDYDLDRGMVFLVSEDDPRVNLSLPFWDDRTFPQRVPTGRYLAFLALDSLSCDVTRLTIAPGGTQWHPELRESGSVHVEVRSNGVGVAGQAVEVFDARGERVPRLTDARFLSIGAPAGAVVVPTDAGGQTWIWGLRPDTYSIRVGDRKTPVTVQAGQESKAVIRLGE